MPWEGESEEVEWVLREGEMGAEREVGHSKERGKKKPEEKRKERKRRVLERKTEGKERKKGT